MNTYRSAARPTIIYVGLATLVVGISWCAYLAAAETTSVPHTPDFLSTADKMVPRESATPTVKQKSQTGKTVADAIEASDTAGMILSDELSQEIDASINASASGGHVTGNSNDGSRDGYRQTGLSTRNFEISTRLQLAALQPSPPAPRPAFNLPRPSSTPNRIAVYPPSESTAFSGDAFERSLKNRIDVDAATPSAVTTGFGPIDWQAELNEVSEDDAPSPLLSLSNRTTQYPPSLPATPAPQVRPQPLAHPLPQTTVPSSVASHLIAPTPAAPSPAAPTPAAPSPAAPTPNAPSPAAPTPSARVNTAPPTTARPKVARPIVAPPIPQATTHETRVPARPVGFAINRQPVPMQSSIAPAPMPPAPVPAQIRPAQPQWVMPSTRQTTTPYALRPQPAPQPRMPGQQRPVVHQQPQLAPPIQPAPLPPRTTLGMPRVHQQPAIVAPSIDTAAVPPVDPSINVQSRLFALPASAPVESPPALFASHVDPQETGGSLESGVPQGSPTQSVSETTQACEQNYFYDDFSASVMEPESMWHDGGREAFPYDAKAPTPTQYPLIQWGRTWYGDGITPRGKNWFGDANLVRPKFYVYGDFRTGIQSGRNAGGRADNWANRLNLDMDLQLTSTERFHAFVGPLDKNNQFTRIENIDGQLRYRNEMDWTPVTGFFEGDLGVILGAMQNHSADFDLPVSVGLVPLLFQNGIWMEDAVTAAAFSLPARHSNLLNWSNYDATFFAVVDQLNSPAFANASDAQAIGTAWFIEAYGGYIETGYAYLRERNRSELSYHNITASFTRRYFDRISNSVRVIVNTGQDLPKSSRTADGALLLVENSLITSRPLTFVPYANFFVGWDRPQSVARAGLSGGILRNTGINFDTDGLNGFATLDPTANDTAGTSIGVDLIGKDLDRQLLVELSYLTPHGGSNPNVPGDQYGVGTRYQFPITNATLIRMDAMYGWRDGLPDVYGTRIEYRWKF
ncbi:hypothetical protein Pla52nx_004879 [Stieleria varia]|uniref:hypothetical protein n=1 Tax=Stieleria varia TaxID=2528005 RepID=UPI00313E30C0